MRIRRILNVIKPQYIYKSNYSKYYRTLPILERSILLDAQHGDSVNGNIYYLLKELTTNKEYVDYKIFLNAKPYKYNLIKKFLENKKIKNVTIIKNNSKRYYQMFAQAQFLFTDTSFPVFYVKKEGQVVFNVWHGTPFKTLGRSDKTEFHRLGNIQRNFCLSDYLLYPNEYMMEHMLKDYMLSNISNAKVMLEGYPRNEIFFDSNTREKVRKEMKLENKEVFVYMPTWRGIVNGVDEKNNVVQEYLDEIDLKLNKDQTLYVNLHHFVNKQINYKKFKNIKPFPKKYETYEFLNVADCLITDYSSVFFDFANTRKKIILFAYDEKEYFENRGLYINFDELPFPKVKNVDELIKEMNNSKKYDDTEFLKKFCSYDNINASKRICETIILKKKSDIVIKELSRNNKKNILIYPGNLAKNGITTSLLNLLNKVKLKENNYFVTFMTRRVTHNKKVITNFPQEVNYIPLLGKMNMSIGHKIISFLYNKKIISIDKLLKYVKDDYELEIKRLYGTTKFDTVIQFNGYDYKKIILYSLFDANRIIYAHNDMYSEIVKKGNMRFDACKYAYETYDKIALVTDDLIETTNKIADVKEKINICNNLFDYKRILKLSKEKIEFDENTISNVEQRELEQVLNNSKITKFIAIGRFSKEKGNDRLLEAFEQFWQKHENTYLIIIGGYGKEYNPLLKCLENMKCKNNVALIRFMNNPYPVLNKCDSLILPSRYEGFGLVLIEADVLGKPVVSTNIVGPSNFIKKHNGQLVENSVQGIEEGLKLLYEKKVNPMNVDYEEYNKNAINQFYKLLNKGEEL